MRTLPFHFLKTIAWFALVAISVGRANAVDGEEYVRNELPKSMEGVGIDEHLGETIPAELTFRNSRGIQTSLSELMETGKPVILTLNYSNCPGLCIAQLNGLVRGINEVSSLKLGTDFLLVSISIDPRETTAKAAATQKRYSQDLFDQHDAAAWQFWTGNQENIAALTRAVGFRYTYDSKHDQYNHPSAAIFLSPQGKITRYLYELGFTGNTLKMATVEAGEGQVGSPMDMIALWCVHYDPLENRYSASARRLMSIAGAFFVVIGLVASVPFWVRRHGLKGTSTTSHEPELSQAGLPSATSVELRDKLERLDSKS